MHCHLAIIDIYDICVLEAGIVDPHDKYECSKKFQKKHIVRNDPSHVLRHNHTLSQAMVIGRLAHYAFDAVLLSTVFAGVKRTSGYT